MLYKRLKRVFILSAFIPMGIFEFCLIALYFTFHGISKIGSFSEKIADNIWLFGEKLPTIDFYFPKKKSHYRKDAVPETIKVKYFQWFGNKDQTDYPLWVVEGVKKGSIWFLNLGTKDIKMMVKTDYGVVEAKATDYIIQINNTSGRIILMGQKAFESWKNKKGKK